MKRGLILIVLLISISGALAFEVAVTPVAKEFPVNKQGEFIIQITNDKAFTDTFYLKNIRDPSWQFITDPTVDYISGITILPEQEKSTRLFISDPATSIGRKFVSLTITSDKTNQTIVENLDVIVRKGEYDPDVTVTSTPIRIDPRETESFSILLQNNNPGEFYGMELTVQGDLIEKKTAFDLLANEYKSVKFTLDLPDNIKPQQDTVNIILTYNNEIIYNGIEQIEILSYAGNLNRGYRLEKDFLRSTEIITLSNNANDIVTEEFTLEAKLTDRIFAKTSPRAQIITEDGKRYYSWALSLSPGETATLTIGKSYRLAFVILLLIFIVCAYLIYSKPAIIMRKETVDIKIHENSIKEIKIRVLIKNRKSYMLSDVVLLDRLPHITRLGDSVITPKRVLKHTKHGPIVEWHLGNMDPGERRELTYTMHSNLGVFGNLDLKPAMVKYKSHGREHKAYSNVVSVGAE